MLLISKSLAGLAQKTMQIHTIRLHPGDDLKIELEKFALKEKVEAAAILTCVGSLKKANLRFADQKTPAVFEEKFEIISLVGTFSKHGTHLHIGLSDATGKTIGGHLLEGNIIYTTAEILIGIPEKTSYLRTIDPKTGFKELEVKFED